MTRSTNEPPYEKKDTSFGSLVALMGLLLILLGGTLLLTRAFDKRLNRRMSPRQSSTAAPNHALPPEPRLQVNPPVDLVRLRDVEDVTLNNYAWVDPDKGIVHVPIARAMEILAERGLPARSGQEETPQ